MNFITNHIGTWLATSFAVLLTIFSDKIIERIRLGINKADLRTKYFEELATDLSAYIFWAEVYLERFEKKWTDDQDDLEAVAEELNVAMTTLMKKEYVYKSWVNRYWTQKQKEEFISVFIAIKAVDYASHAFNDSGNEQEKSKTFRNELDLLHKKADRWLTESIR